MPLLTVREPRAVVLIRDISYSPLIYYVMSGGGGMSENLTPISFLCQPEPSQ